ncbi:LacI family DNA-binding transcriptional regulator [Microbacterium sp. STN6]|uniref:LacI family DNA-binding transcriptional regulator n=1 Tax=Microbacterium sp. STN6 TaxID=2995588 RepID=UPI002260CCD3|nr:LacI family DNA-binding transcriptional regulator [Microbacterium sp. STN6]MCX7522569.1 LacI family DNA-binding transcriptional regulator [Microbacterium sp. STN6]
MPAERSAVTRTDVAKLAGVSVAVVSYVVNSSPKSVAPTTRAKVLNAIDQLGYRPNAAARALKSGRSRLLGLIIPDNTNLYFAEIVAKVEEYASLSGYDVLSGSSSRSLAREAALKRQMLLRQVDGLLLLSNESRPDVSDFQNANVPVVLLGRQEGFEGAIAVGDDHRAASYAAVTHLIAHGHDNIAMLIGDSPSGGRERGWEDALAASPGTRGIVIRRPFTRAGGYSGVDELLSGAHDHPTACFVGSDIQAVGLLRALHERAIRIPDDMAIVSFDGAEESEYCWPPLTAIRQPVSLIAETAVAAAIERRSDDFISYSAELVIRKSCGCDGAAAF